jgi:type II secretory pathway pseudopilin PulG
VNTVNKMSSDECRASNVVPAVSGRSSLDPRPSSAFTLIEVMLVVVLLSLIVIALMAVFTNTQRAFRASITQTDVLEGGRSAMDLIAGDLREMQASGGVSNNAVNFYVAVPPGYAPLVQSLAASSALRTNMLETIFILNRQNLTWTGVGYAVDTNATTTINPLYRYTISTNTAVNPLVLYNTFVTLVNNGAYTNMSRLVDGVVELRLRAYDTNGVWMNSTYTNAVNFYPFAVTLGETSFAMYSNTLPASVGIELGVLEDRTVQRAESRLAGPARSNYLRDQAGQVHVFRQQVAIPNVDPSAYQ